jgi:hypothetical protein
MDSDNIVHVTCWVCWWFYEQENKVIREENDENE